MRTPTEAKANDISERNGWTDWHTQIDKLQEELHELKKAKTLAQKQNEASDVQFVLNGLLQSIGLDNETSLQMSIKKNTIRESNPNYMR
jgi:TPP-dependent 2-oxoacid decarboxylase